MLPNTFFRAEDLLHNLLPLRGPARRNAKLGHPPHFSELERTFLLRHSSPLQMLIERFRGRSTRRDV